jgi:hypothetical protein
MCCGNIASSLAYSALANGTPPLISPMSGFCSGHPATETQLVSQFHSAPNRFVCEVLKTYCSRRNPVRSHGRVGETSRQTDTREKICVISAMLFFEIVGGIGNRIGRRPAFSRLNLNREHGYAWRSNCMLEGIVCVGGHVATRR